MAWAKVKGPGGGDAAVTEPVGARMPGRKVTPLETADAPVWLLGVATALLLAAPAGLCEADATSAPSPAGQQRHVLSTWPKTWSAMRCVSVTSMWNCLINKDNAHDVCQVGV